MKSRTELNSICGYKERAADFDELVQILDGQLRLITPGDMEAAGGDRERRADSVHAEPGSHSDSHFYQLTHDYLVPPCRSLAAADRNGELCRQSTAPTGRCYALYQSKPESQLLRRGGSF